MFEVRPAHRVSYICFEYKGKSSSQFFPNWRLVTVSFIFCSSPVSTHLYCTVLQLSDTLVYEIEHSPKFVDVVEVRVRGTYCLHLTKWNRNIATKIFLAFIENYVFVTLTSMFLYCFCISLTQEYTSPYISIYLH